MIIELILLIISTTNTEIKAESCTTMSMHTRATFEYLDTSYQVEPLFNKICADVDTRKHFINTNY